ncbi:glucose-induced degradation complex subunit VID24 SCDLUD_000568 [Saccharomycodes ludwigii]|uniref:glucose-induced degradation complex subunit VID24 n=1 Tax=Saccharomycodes ludwigii TaxID=36035 RepID=UPI001E81F9B5|nr:hypothetical protein SCDLUD_000568 [Saccharomycodes ludwigii]KAH3902968.1 hypothetical protein SCDLUD_000568 [Saccharomycodes ludwigii]
MVIQQQEQQKNVSANNTTLHNTLVSTINTNNDSNNITTSNASKVDRTHAKDAQFHYYYPYNIDDDNENHSCDYFNKSAEPNITPPLTPVPLSLNTVNSNTSNTTTADSLINLKEHFITFTDNKRITSDDNAKAENGNVKIMKPYLNNDKSNYARCDETSSIACFTPKKIPYFQPGMVFKGYQHNGYLKYNVEISIKSNADSSFLPYITGYLRIYGLTNKSSEITTFFKGYYLDNMDKLLSSNCTGKTSSTTCSSATETLNADHKNMAHYVDSMYSNTSTSSGDNNGNNSVFPEDDIDLLHWDKLKDELTFINRNTSVNNRGSKSDIIFMKWKEQFLVPDSDVTSIKGASFAGFYYIMVDVKNNKIYGFYFHETAEKFQKIELNLQKSDYGNSTLYQTYEFN